MPAEARSFYVCTFRLQRKYHKHRSRIVKDLINVAASDRVNAATHLIAIAMRPVYVLRVATKNWRRTYIKSAPTTQRAQITNNADP